MKANTRLIKIILQSVALHWPSACQKTEIWAVSVIRNLWYLEDQQDPSKLYKGPDQDKNFITWRVTKSGQLWTGLQALNGPHLGSVSVGSGLADLSWCWSPAAGGAAPLNRPPSAAACSSGPGSPSGSGIFPVSGWQSHHPRADKSQPPQSSPTPPWLKPVERGNPPNATSCPDKWTLLSEGRSGITTSWKISCLKAILSHDYWSQTAFRHYVPVYFRFCSKRVPSSESFFLFFFFPLMANFNDVMHYRHLLSSHVNVLIAMSCVWSCKRTWSRFVHG